MTETVSDIPAPPPVLPDRMPVAKHLDPAAALAFRTPTQDHVLSADGKAAGLLTLLGLMFTVLARFSGTVADLVGRWGGGAGVTTLAVICITLLSAHALLAVGAVVQSFRTISPRFPGAAPSLAFFGDIASLSRDEYIRRVEALMPDEALDQMLSYNHTAARIAVEKFRQLRRAMALFKYAAMCWLPLVTILAARALWS
jgi:hypothetical protein